jgi:putative hemolysin
MLPIIAMIFLIILSGLMVAAETALVAVSDNQVEEDADSGNKKAKRVLAVLEDPKKYHTTLQVLTVLSAIINGAIALDAFSTDIVLWFSTTASWIEPIVLIIVAILLLVFHVVFGQLIPRRLANKHPEMFAYGLIGLVIFLKKLFIPLTSVLTFLSTIIGRLFGLLPSEGERRVTEEEIRNIVEEGSKSGNIDEEESEMIQNIFDFSDTTVDTIMTHRTEISAINVKSTKKEIFDYVLKEQYTRFPVYQGSLDHIIGTLHVKDLLKYVENTEERFSIKRLLRPPYFIPESKKTSDLFKEMQKKKNHIAIVLDEYGGTAGIVTIEDLIEEVLGNIKDEYDDDEIDIMEINKDEFEVDGLISINDVEDIIEADLPVDDYDTLSGFILGQLGRFPDEKEKVIIEYHSFTFEVLEREGKVISKVKVIRKPKPEEDDRQVE